MSVVAEGATALERVPTTRTRAILGRLSAERARVAAESPRPQPTHGSRYCTERSNAQRTHGCTTGLWCAVRRRHSSAGAPGLSGTTDGGAAAARRSSAWVRTRYPVVGWPLAACQRRIAARVRGPNRPSAASSADGSCAALAFAREAATRADAVAGPQTGSAGAEHAVTPATSCSARIGIDVATHVINANYFGRSTRMRLAGWWAAPGACETARFPLGGRVGHGCTGSAITRELGYPFNRSQGRNGATDRPARVVSGA